MKKKFKMPTAYTILFLLLAIIFVLTHIISGVRGASFPELIMSPLNGMIGVRDMELTVAVNEAAAYGVEAQLDVIREAGSQLLSPGNQGRMSGAIDVGMFVFIIGGFLGIVQKTGALDAGVGSLVAKLKGGRELLLIPVLMLLFSIGGTTFGMAEETLALYALMGATMIKAGFDPLVSVGVILMGAYAGSLGSTINPFSVGASIAAAEAVGTTMERATIIGVGSALWLGVLAIGIWYVMRYAKKVYADKTNSLMSEEERQVATSALVGNKDAGVAPEFTGKRKLVLSLFAFTFVVMILGIVPWGSFDVGFLNRLDEFFGNHTAWFMGSQLGWWWFSELTIWFFVMALVIGLVYRMKERDMVSSFIAGAADMTGVVFIIGISRGVSFMMTNTGLDIYLLDQLSGALSGVSGPLFTVMAFFTYIPLSFLIGSSSGLASVSMPIFAPLAASLGMRPEIVVGAFTGAAGWLAFASPANPIMMGGLEISKVEYGTWLKFIGKFMAIILVWILFVLAVASLILA